MRRALLIAGLWACGRVVASPPPAPLRIAPGGAYRGRPVHVRVIGDGFVIEMASVDAEAQHLHTIYHDLGNVLGRSA